MANVSFGFYPTPHINRAYVERALTRSFPKYTIDFRWPIGAAVFENFRVLTFKATKNGTTEN